MKHPLKATGFFKPYTGASYTLKNTGTGVYIIKKAGKVVYVGMSRKDLQNTLYRHFQQWTDRRGKWARSAQPYERVTYYGQDRDLFLVKVVYCKGAREAEILEQLLIKKLKPKDNTLKLALFTDREYNTVLEKFQNTESWNSSSTDLPF